MACLQGLWLELKCFLTAEACRDDDTACHVAPLLDTCDARLAALGRNLVASLCARQWAQSKMLCCHSICADVIGGPSFTRHRLPVSQLRQTAPS